MAHLGDVSIRNGQFCATIDKTEAGMRFKMFGPCREDKQHAVRDLAYIRAAATGAPTRLDELRAMKLATKILQDEAKAATRGGIESIGPVTGTKPLRGNIAFSKTGPLLPKANRAQGSLHVQGARLAVQRVLYTSSQLAWTCKECFARSSFRVIHSIDILVPKI